MKYLVSFQYRAVFYTAGQSARGNEPVDTIQLFDDHPAKYLADCLKEENEVRRAWNDGSVKTGTRADVITRIYSITEIPDPLLTAEQLEILS